MNKPSAALDYYQKFLELEPAGPSSDLARQALADLKRGPSVVARQREETPPRNFPQGSKVAEVEPPKPAPEVSRPTEPPKPPPPPPSAPVPAPSPPPRPVETQAVAAAEAPALLGPRWPRPNFPKVAPGKRDAALAQFNKGAQYQKDGLLDAATFCYRDALKLDPTLTMAYYNLGTVLQAQAMTNQAIEAYLRALNQQPSFNNARLNLAILFEGQGYLADAAEQYETILREAPGEATPHFALGRLYAMQPQTHASARQHYQRYLELVPNAADAARVQQIIQQLK